MHRNWRVYWTKEEVAHNTLWGEGGTEGSRGAHHNHTSQTGRVPYLCCSNLIPATCTDGERDGLGLSKTVNVCLSQSYRRVDRCFRNFSG